MKTKFILASFLVSTSSIAQQADSTLIGGSFQDTSQYIAQQTTPTPTVCPSAVLQWGVQGVYCKQSIAETTEGNEQYLVDQDPSDNSYGSARFTCSSGNWINTSASCSAPTQVNNMPYSIPNEPTEVHNMPYSIPNEPEPTTSQPYQGYCPPNYICGWQVSEPEPTTPTTNTTTYDPHVYYYQSVR